MKLTELQPRFLKQCDSHSFHHVDAIGEADGIMFLCPKCIEGKPDGVGVHSVICWQPHVSQDIRPSPGRWKFKGTGFDDLSLEANSSSIALSGGCNAHFFICNGAIAMA